MWGGEAWAFRLSPSDPGHFCCFVKLRWTLQRVQILQMTMTSSCSRIFPLPLEVSVLAVPTGWVLLDVTSQSLWTPWLSPSHSKCWFHFFVLTDAQPLHFFHAFLLLNMGYRLALAEGHWKHGLTHGHSDKLNILTPLPSHMEWNGHPMDLCKYAKC